MTDSHKPEDSTSAADDAALEKAAADQSQDPSAEGAAEEEKKEELQLEVSIEKRGACERHITVVVPRTDIDRYFEREFSELVNSAQVPGFRPGRAPRKLIEHRFKKDVGERVKGNLLMDGIAQVSQREELSPISEPDLKLDAVELPDEGPMTFEFDLEVRPEFDLPQWKGLKIERPVRDFSAADVDTALQNVLSRRGQLVPLDGPAGAGDYIATKLTFKDGERVLSHSDEELIRIRSVLSFRDGKIENFDKLMEGVRGGDTRVAQAVLTGDAPSEELRGKTITAVFEVQEVKRLELPELTAELLHEIGGFESVAELRDAVKESLEKRLGYQQHQSARDQITAKLTVGADWDLPPDLLRRQGRREVQRAIMELQRSGFSDDEIKTRENELRQNILANTARALKEHFIFERIAEEEKIEPAEDDYDAEIGLIAQQSEQTPRRVRARLEKEGMMDVLRNQIIERKVIELILSHAEFKEVPYTPEGIVAEAIDQGVTGTEESEIPQAQPETGHAPYEEGAKAAGESHWPPHG